MADVLGNPNISETPIHSLRPDLCHVVRSTSLPFTQQFPLAFRFVRCSQSHPPCNPPEEHNQPCRKCSRCCCRSARGWREDDCPAYRRYLPPRDDVQVCRYRTGCCRGKSTFATGQSTDSSIHNASKAGRTGECD